MKDLMDKEVNRLDESERLKAAVPALMIALLLGELITGGAQRQGIRLFDEHFFSEVVLWAFLFLIAYVPILNFLATRAAQRGRQEAEDRGKRR